MGDPLILQSPDLRVVVDAARGADVLSLTHRGRDLDVLFSTPWRERAERVRTGLETPTSTDPVAGPLEQYAGGWQLLCPNAGAPRVVAGAPVGFHGEAWLAGWDVVEADELNARLRTELHTVPVLIEREVTLDAGSASMTITDVLTNLSEVELEVDYVSHPAFGGAFIDGRVTVDTGARRFTADPDTTGGAVPAGSVADWPYAADGVDLRIVPGPGERRMLFGWLSDFDGHWASITNLDLGLRVRLDWDGTHLPYAWFWQELNWTAGYPWFRRARAIAIEPSSTTTGGPQRHSVLRLEASASIRLPVSITLDETRPEQEESA